MKSEFKTRRRDLSASSLIVDESYQNPVVESHVAKIVAEFNPDYLGVFHVSERSNGRLALLDGLHRRAALDRLGKLTMMVHCLVYSGLSVKDEARLFLKLNAYKNKTAMTKFRAGLSAGLQREAAIAEIVKSCGYTIGTGTAVDTLQCTAALCKVYDKCGADGLLAVLRLARSAWPDCRSLNSVVVCGLGLIFSRFNGELDVKRLETKTKRGVTHDALIGKARSRRGVMGGDVATNVADTLIDIYNRQLTSGRLLNLRASR